METYLQGSIMNSKFFICIIIHCMYVLQCEKITSLAIWLFNNQTGTILVHIYPLIRHSRLPAGNALWFCQNFLFLFFFFRRQGFRMITFDRQAGPLQNFNRSHIMVIGRSVLFSPQPPQNPPPPPPEKLFACVSEPQEHFWKKKLTRTRRSGVF